MHRRHRQPPIKFRSGPRGTSTIHAARGLQRAVKSEPQPLQTIDVVATRMSLSMPRASDADITFERIAVTPEQITAWALPTRPTKPSDTRSKSFGEISVELDAIEPNRLRALVQEAIERHLPADQFAALKAAEASEREIITRLVGEIARKRLRSRRWRG